MEIRRRFKNIVNKPINENITHKVRGTYGYCDEWLKKKIGFGPSTFKDNDTFLRYLNKPCDPSILALWRILYGFLMLKDIMKERGLSNLEGRWGDENICHFPLLDFLDVLPLEWMCIVYGMMILGCIGIILGFLFRTSCFIFTCGYWYLFLLDKPNWNNHSYLFGLNGIMFLMSDANHYWSIDGFLWPKINNTDIPLRNYALFKTQIFIVYFFAGIKKMDLDWLSGYSMDGLAGRNFVFQPFLYLVSEETVDLVIVHWGGFFIDLTMGFFLIFEDVQFVAFIILTSFHFMNATIFSIGMFPYAMLASNFLFLRYDFLKKLIIKLPRQLQKVLPSTDEAKPNTDCVYDEENKTDSQELPDDDKAPKSKKVSHSWTKKQKLKTTIVVAYLFVQAFLPFSHSITKGYNNWTNGLYGYSWDMMIHSWSTLAARITYLNKDTGEIGYLSPYHWCEGRKDWTSSADMAKQYAFCIENRLKAYNLYNISLYFDVWKSMNDRFQQRVFNPYVDILDAEWSAFRSTPWLLPVLTEYSDWRGTLNRLQTEYLNTSKSVDITFMSDFPGFHLDNFIQEELENTTIHVLKGEIVVEIEEDVLINITLKEEETAQVPSGKFHTIYTISSIPSCYMYTYENTTHTRLNILIENYTRLIEKEKEFKNIILSDGLKYSNNEIESENQTEQTLEEFEASLEDSEKQFIYDYVAKNEYIASQSNRNLMYIITDYLRAEALELYHNFMKIRIALISIFSNRSFNSVKDELYSMHDGDMSVENGS